MKKILKLLLIGLLGMSLVACNQSDNSNDNLDEENEVEEEENVSNLDWWNVTGIGNILPTPDSTTDGEINFDQSDYFDASITTYEEDYYDTYVSLCKEAGFNVDGDLFSTDIYYYAYDKDGNKLEVFDWTDHIDINLNESIVNETLSWPSNGPAAQLPDPNATNGKIKSDTYNYFYAQVVGFSTEDLSEYADKCMSNGYNVDYFLSDTHFDAKNEAGDTLLLQYQGFDTMVISLTLAE